MNGPPLRYLRPLLPNAEIAEHDVQQFLYVDASCQAAKGLQRSPQLFGYELRFGGLKTLLKGLFGSLQMRSMSGAADRGRHAAQLSRNQLRDPRDEFIEPLARQC